MKSNRFLGSILLISGTSIGAAMLALPIKSGFSGFFPSIAVLPILWLFFLITAFLILDVNLSIKGETNMVSMAEKTLGLPGKVVCWIVYLLLLYSLTAAYISGSAPVFSEFFTGITGIDLPKWISPLLIIGFFGVFIYQGTKWVDYINRVFIIGLAVTYIMIVAFAPSQVNPKLLAHCDPKAILVAIPLLFTSFGYHIIIPSLTTYERHNVSKLRLTILIGSLIPLFVYFLWEFFVMGIVPLSGNENSLVQAFKEAAPSTKPLTQLINHPIAELGARFLAFFAIVTSFLGVSLSLRDFLRDGLKMKSGKKGRLMASVLTFSPPLIFVLSYPRAFIIALQYAGLFVAILLGILPALMAWKLKKYKSFWGRTLLVTVILGSLFAIVLEFMDEGGAFTHIIEPYLS